MRIKQSFIALFLMLISTVVNATTPQAVTTTKAQLAVNLVESYYKTILDQDLNGFLNNLSDDVVHDINEGETEVGKDKFKSFMENQFAEGKIAIKDMVIITSPDGRYATARYTCSGRYKKTEAGLPEAKGQKWELPVVTFFEIKNDKLTHVSVFFNEKSFVKQVSKQ